MTPHDQITFDGDVAWLVFHGGRPLEIWQRRDRLCDYLNYTKIAYDEVHLDDCGDCDGSGRHTFEIEVGVPCSPRAGLCDHKRCGLRVLRVHVVEVLPIHYDFTQAGQAAVIMTSPQMVYQPGPRHHDGLDQSWPITLPPAAKPGMWAVQLAVHS